MELSDEAKKEIEEALAELQEATDEAAKFMAQALEPGKDVLGVDFEAMERAHERLRKTEQKYQDVKKKHFGF